MKQTIIQCVTALVCVVAICVTSVISIGNYTEAKVEAAKNAGQVTSNNPSQSGEVVTDPSGEVVTDPSGETVTDPSGETATDPSTDPTSAQVGGTTAKSGTTTKAGSSVPSTPAAIATYYNTAVNKVVSSNAGYKKSRVTSLSNLNGGALLKIKLVTDTVNDFLGVGTIPYNKTKGSKDIYMSAASLKSTDISSANCTNSNGIYTITMTLKSGKNSASSAGVSDTTALGRCGLYAGNGDKKAYDYKSSENLYKSINGIDVASVESITESISNSKITAKIDSKTGKLVSLTIGFNWAVSLTKVKYTVATIKSATGNAVTTTTFSNFQF